MSSLLPLLVIICVISSIVNKAKQGTKKSQKTSPKSGVHPSVPVSAPLSEIPLNRMNPAVSPLPDIPSEEEEELTEHAETAAAAFLREQPADSCNAPDGVLCAQAVSKDGSPLEEGESGYIEDHLDFSENQEPSSTRTCNPFAADLMRGILFTEILGKPKSLRCGRRL